MRKAVFFDIDGTLWDRERVIADSTREAIRRMRENEAYVFINSGRAPGFIKDPTLLSLGFDGILAGCGTYVAFGGEELFYKELPVELVKRTLEVMRRYGMPVILEGKTYHYVDEEEFWDDPYLGILKKELGDTLLGIRENEMKWEACKFSASIKRDDFEDALLELSDAYHFLVHGKNVVEGVPKGCSKATGIQVVCERLGIAREDTYAFGDSVNDLEMLEYVAHGIVMGNGSSEAKAVADYVTGSLHEDGIYEACRHFRLI